MRRADCEMGPRPCPYILCKHHLGMEISTRDGMGFTIDEDGPLVRYPVQPDETIESCVLDVALRGGATLEEIAAVTSITRERVRQVEERALAKVRNADELDDLEDAPSFSPAEVVVA